MFRIAVVLVVLLGPVTAAADDSSLANDPTKVKLFNKPDEGNVPPDGPGPREGVLLQQAVIARHRALGGWHETRSRLGP